MLKETTGIVTRWKHTMRPRGWSLAEPWIWLGTILIAMGSGRAYSQQEPAVLSGVQYLKHHYANQAPGESAMIALGLLKADVPHNDPAVETCVARFKARFQSSSYEPQRMNGSGIYEAAAAAMALANLDAEGHRGEIAMIATYILGQQRANGSWDYTGRDFGDSSITQYAILGLWEAENAGVDMSPSVWERTASWYLSNQHSNGAWVYHNDEPQYTETLSMTAAGVGSLLICQRQLQRFRHDHRETSPLLKTLSTETKDEFKPSITNQRIDQAVSKGMGWISSSFSPDSPIAGPSPFYMLYGIERIGALADRQSIGRLDWFERGRAYIRKNQRADGSFPGAHGNEMNTVWAILFLTKSTAKTSKTYQDPAARSRHASGRARAADRPDVHDRGRRSCRQPSHERSHRGDARRARGPARGAGRLGRRRARRPVLPRGPRRAPAVQDAIPQDAHRSRPRAPQGCCLVAGPYRRHGCRTAADRRLDGP